MQVVIEIPEELYKKEVYFNLDMIDVIAPAVHKGIPLPKGHGRLIDADELEKKAVGADDMYMLHEIDEAPTIIEVDKEE